jgi:hypothetical protein
VAATVNAVFADVAGLHVAAEVAAVHLGSLTDAPPVGELENEIEVAWQRAYDKADY